MINVAILFGGKSPEHEVSVISANQAIQALKDHRQYKVIPIYVSKEGNWYTSEKLTDLKNYKNLKTLQKECQQIDVSFSKKGFTYTTTGFFKKTIDIKIDVAFPVFHGRHGEDTTNSQSQVSSLGALLGGLPYAQPPKLCGSMHPGFGGPGALALPPC